MNDKLNLIDNEALRAALAAYFVFLRENYLGWNKDGYDGGDQWINDAPGKNVVRVLHATFRRSIDGSLELNQRSSHSFVVLRDIEKDGKKFLAGDILMAASWKTPAWNKARGNVFTGYGSASWTGAGYLS